MRPFVLTIAGFDPSNGAGLTADIKTMEQHQVYGLSICTGITLQTEDTFYDVRWEKLEDILKAIKVLLAKYPVSAIKIGILPNMDYLEQIIKTIHHINPSIKIILDPIFKSSTGFDFMKIEHREVFFDLLKKVYLLTPNRLELKQLFPTESIEESCLALKQYCAVFLKGGHSSTDLGTDYLYTQNDIIKLEPTEGNYTEKHGSGCILSSAVASNLALDKDLRTACQSAKHYIELILSSNTTLLAYHAS